MQNVVAKSERRPRRLRLVAIACAVVAVLVALDIALCYLMLPYGGECEAIWWQYYRHKDDDRIDSVIVGTSYAMQCIDGRVLDRALGTHTLAVATPNQSPTASLIAIQDAYEDHHIKRALVGISLESAQKNKSMVSYDIAFALAEAQGRSLPHALRVYTRAVLGYPNFGDTSSLAALVPWTSWNVGWNASSIRRNCEQRVTMNALEASKTKGLYITAHGYAPVGGEIDRNRVCTYASAASPDEYEFDENLIEDYREICRYCKAHDIDVCFTTTPWIPYLLFRYEREGGYALAVKPFVDAIEQEGATFLDCALLRDEHLRVPAREFYNEQHLNRKGSQRFSKVLGKLLADREAGKDVTGLFYEHSVAGWDEYLRANDDLSIMTYTATTRPGGIELAMKSFTGANCEVEYRVAREREGEQDEILRPYGTEDSFFYPVEGHGLMTIKVSARLVGSDLDELRSCRREIMY